MFRNKQVILSRNGVLVILAIMIALAAFVLFGLDREEPLPVESGVSETSSVIALGRTVYASQCAACHGANLEGQPNWRERKPDGRLPAPPHDETGHTWHHDDATLFNLTKYGLSALIGRPVETDMPAYEGVLTDEQIRAVLAYIKSRWPAEIRERQAEISRQAAAERG